MCVCVRALIKGGEERTLVGVEQGWHWQPGLLHKQRRKEERSVGSSHCFNWMRNLFEDLNENHIARKKDSGRDFNLIFVHL
ncbi:hypothetical protein QQP08_026794 [Theobroma cacao]|nr:hypothetical protein QQP08_026794 [Theobroma cacao]